MSHLENDLKMALRRPEPPEGFAARVLARVNAPEAPQPAWWERLRMMLLPPRVQWVALCLIASIVIPTAAIQYRRQRERQVEGERAKEQLVFAVRVAGHKLHRVQQKVLEMGRMETRL
jgi:hypothetical protein